jgi:DNA repair photolyase
LVLRDIDIYERMAKKLPVSVNLSIPTLDEEAWRATEPHTPSPAARLDAVAELRSRGIDSGVLIAPLMPGINDDPEQVQPLVEEAKAAGATFLGGLALHLRDGVKEVFMAWLQEKRPDLVPQYEQLYRGRAYMKPEDRKHATRAVKGWGRSGVRKNASRKSTSRAGGAGGEPPRAVQFVEHGGSPPVTGPARQEALF